MADDRQGTASSLRRLTAGRRSAEERAEARALGVDRSGNPTARALGVNPRELVRQELVADMKTASRLSAQLRGKALAQLTRGHGHLPPPRRR